MVVQSGKLSVNWRNISITLKTPVFDSHGVAQRYQLRRNTTADSNIRNPTIAAIATNASRFFRVSRMRTTADKANPRTTTNYEGAAAMPLY